MSANQVGFKIQKGQSQALLSTATGARFFWSSSYLIQREGRLSGGSPKQISWGLNLMSILFQNVEYLLTSIAPLGEEIIMIATRDPY